MGWLTMVYRKFYQRICTINVERFTGLNFCGFQEYLKNLFVNIYWYIGSSYYGVVILNVRQSFPVQTLMNSICENSESFGIWNFHQVNKLQSRVQIIPKILPNSIKCTSAINRKPHI